MFTLHHGFWLYFFTRHHAKVWQIVIGSMLPDYVYVVMVAIMIGKGQLGWSDVVHMDPTMMMSLLPLYPWVVKMDLIGHSAVIWGSVFLFTLIPVLSVIRSFVVGWGTHLFIDGVTHGAYANYFLYPLSLTRVHSPVSYWEPQYFAHEFRVVNWTLMLITAIYLLGRWWMKKHKSEE